MKHYQLELTDSNGHTRIVSAYGRNLTEAIQDGVVWKGSQIIAHNGGGSVTIEPSPLPTERLEVSVHSVRQIKD